MRALLAMSHVFVYPSHGEGMPQPVLEAMAAGRPIVTTDIAGCRDTVDERVNGCFAEPRDADALADGDGELLEATRSHSSDRASEPREGGALLRRRLGQPIAALPRWRLAERPRAAGVERVAEPGLAERRRGSTSMSRRIAWRPSSIR